MLVRFSRTTPEFPKDKGQPSVGDTWDPVPVFNAFASEESQILSVHLDPCGLSRVTSVGS